MERYAKIVVTHFGWHGLGKDLLQGRHGLIGTVSRGGTAIYLRRAKKVIAHCEFRTSTRFKVRERRKRNHAPTVVLDIKLAHIFDVRAVIAFRLDIDLPLPAKAIEVIDEQPAHECLNGSIDIVDGHALLDDFVTVDIHELLRYAAQKGRTHACDLGAFTSSRQKRIQVRREELDIFAVPIFKNESEPSRGTYARDGGR